jgi:4-hydroxythreonine-4-phosphate dehydrogenase
VEGINITKPLPADTLFVEAGKNYLQGTTDKYDCYIANYHDQGLIPIKTIASDKTVNMTIGLDIVRTSPGHGTAFDIAGKNLANPTGMIEAIKAVL